MVYAITSLLEAPAAFDSFASSKNKNSITSISKEAKESINL